MNPPTRNQPAPRRRHGYYIVCDLTGVPDLFGRVRPVLARLVGRPPAEAVTALRPRAQAIVTVWVLLTVPLLSACLALLVVSLPGLAGSAAESLVVHGKSLVAALASGTVVPAVLGALQLVVVAVPLAGLTAALARLVRLIWRSVWGRRSVATVGPERHPNPAASLPRRRPLRPLHLRTRHVSLRPVLCLLLGLVAVVGASFAAGSRSAPRSR